MATKAAAIAKTTIPTATISAVSHAYCLRTSLQAGAAGPVAGAAAGEDIEDSNGLAPIASIFVIVIDAAGRAAVTEGIGTGGAGGLGGLATRSPYTLALGFVKGIIAVSGQGFCADLPRSAPTQ